MAEAAAARPLGEGGAGPGPRHPRTHRRQPVPGRRAAAPPGRDLGGLDGGDVTEAAAGPAVDDVPESVRWVVGQRLSRLGGPVEHVLGVVAVVGQQAELALLRRAVGLGWDDLLAALDVAVAARLLEERPGPPGRYAFHHPIVRDLLYRRLPASERARAHRRVGEALEELTGGAGRLGELADHFALAGEPFADRAVGYAQRSGEQAARRPPLRGGGPPHRQALALLERAGGARGADPKRRVELLCGQAGALAAAGQARQATDAYLLAGGGRPLCRLRRRPGPGRPRAGRPGRLLVGRPRPVGPAGLLGEALVAAGPGDSPARALLLARQAGWRAVAKRLGADEA